MHNHNTCITVRRLLSCCIVQRLNTFPLLSPFQLQTLGKSCSMWRYCTATKSIYLSSSVHFLLPSTCRNVIFNVHICRAAKVGACIALTGSPTHCRGSSIVEAQACTWQCQEIVDGLMPCLKELDLVLPWPFLLPKVASHLISPSLDTHIYKYSRCMQLQYP